MIVAPPHRRHIIHLRLNWRHFAAISFEKALVVPHLFQVAQDSYYNLMLALKMPRRFGYRRIGCCWISNRIGDPIMRARPLINTFR